MGTNRYMGYQPTNWNIKPFDFPVEALYSTLDKLQAKSDQNYQDLNQIPDYIKANALDPDKGVVAGVQKSFKDRIDKLIESGNGDYSNLGKDVVGLKRDLKNELATGKLKAVQSEYDRFHANKESLQKQYEKGDISADDFQKGLGYSLNRYKGIGEIDPVTGVYNTYKDIYIPKFNADKTYDDALDKVKPDSEKIGQWQQSPDGRWFIKNTVSGEVLSEDKLFSGTKDYIANNKEYRDYAQFQDMIGNKDFGKQTLGAIAAKSRLRAFSKVEKDQDMKYNPAIDADLNRAQRERFHKDNQAQQQALFGEQSNVLPTDINNFDVVGDGKRDFQSEYINTDSRNFMEKSPAMMAPGYVKNPMYKTADNNNNQFFDKSHSKYKNDPIYNAAVEKVQEKLNTPEFKKQLDSPNKEIREKALKIYNDNLSSSYNLLSNSQNNNRQRFAMSEKRAETLGFQAFNSRNSLQVQEIDENGRPKDRLQKLSDVENLDKEDVSKMVKEGRLLGEQHLSPMSTGTYGTVIRMNGKRYLTKQLVPQGLKPLMEEEARLGKELLGHNKTVVGTLPYISNQEAVEMKTKVDDDGQIIVSIKGKKSGKNYGTTTLGEIQQASNAYHGEHNPYAKETRDKVKGQEHISGSEFYESGEE